MWRNDSRIDIVFNIPDIAYFILLVESLVELSIGRQQADLGMPATQLREALGRVEGRVVLAVQRTLGIEACTWAHNLDVAVRLGRVQQRKRCTNGRADHEAEKEEAAAKAKADAKAEKDKKAAAKAKADREKMERLVQRELAKIKSASPDQLTLIEKHKEQLAQLQWLSVPVSKLLREQKSGGRKSRNVSIYCLAWSTPLGSRCLVWTQKT